MNNLQQGSRGQEVQQLQEYLKALGLYTGNVDGIFGPRTDAAVRAFQDQQNINVDGIVGQITQGKMDSFQKSSAIMSNPSVQQALAGDSLAANIMSRLQNSGDSRADVMNNVVTTFTGQPISEEEMSQLFQEEYDKLGGYFEAMQDMEKSALESQLGLGKREYERYLENAQSQFGQDKDTADTRAAQQGILFSTGREEGLRNLENTYKSNEEAMRDRLSTNMSDSLRDYQYNWGGKGMNRLADQYQLGTQNYDAFTPRGVVSSGGIKSIYNPKKYDFEGTKRNERKSIADMYAQRRAANRSNSMGMYGYNNQF